MLISLFVTIYMLEHRSHEQKMPGPKRISSTLFFVDWVLLVKGHNYSTRASCSIVESSLLGPLP